MRRVLPSCLIVLVLGCAGPPAAPPDAGADAGFTEDGGADAGTDAGTRPPPPLTQEEKDLLMRRPYRLVVPASYDAGTPVPFVMLLHGYTASGQVQDTYFRMTELAQARGFLLATPDGLVDSTAQRYWNATDFCCGSIGTQKEDDVAYLTAIMNEVRLQYAVDEKRVFFVGHSNGGFMSNRMACDRAPRIAALVSLAGGQWKDESNCAPDAGVSVLQVHGTLDAVIAYGGTAFYPGAVETVSTWAALNGCTTSALTPAGPDLDLVTDLAADETRREAFAGCPAGGAVELWSIQAGSHIPSFNASWGPALYDWLLQHPKP